MKIKKPKCGYCGDKAKLVSGLVIYPHRPDLECLNFWRCEKCSAYVGCHKSGNGYGNGTRPLGNLANKKTRELRNHAHNMFDKIWKSNLKTRSNDYKWLAKKLKTIEVHIGQCNEDECMGIICICNTYLAKAEAISIMMENW